MFTKEGTYLTTTSLNTFWGWGKPLDPFTEVLIEPVFSHPLLNKYPVAFKHYFNVITTNLLLDDHQEMLKVAFLHFQELR